MQNRIYSFFSAKKTSSDYSAIFRAAVPGVVGALIKLSQTDASQIFTYKNKEYCEPESAFSIEPFRTINKFENVVIKKAGLIEPEAATIFVGAVIAGFLETQENITLSFLASAAKKMLSQIKFFALSITKEELTYAVTMIGGVLATELSDAKINKVYGFNSSGHFKTALTYEMLNSLAMRVIQRIEQNQREEEALARQNYSKSANGIIWLNSLLAGISLSFTASECHSLEEVGTGIGFGILLHTASTLLSKYLDFLWNRCTAPVTQQDDQRSPLLKSENTEYGTLTI